jgi:hypothetical protein
MAWAVVDPQARLGALKMGCGNEVWDADDGSWCAYLVGLDLLDGAGVPVVVLVRLRVQLPRQHQYVCETGVSKALQGGGLDS